jgi:hypothetical protein
VEAVGLLFAERVGAGVGGVDEVFGVDAVVHGQECIIKRYPPIRRGWKRIGGPTNGPARSDRRYRLAVAGMGALATLGS